MWKAIKKFLGFSTEEQSEESPIFIEADDPHLAMVVREVLRTGKPIIGTVDEEGNLTMKEVEINDGI